MCLVFGGRSVQIVVGYRNLGELSEKLKPFSYRVLKDDCLDLPDKIFMKRVVQSFIVYRLLPLFKEVLNRKMFLGVDLMSYSFGIVSVIILLCILGIS